MYPGRHQRVRDLLPVRRLHDGVEGRPARGEPFRDDRPGVARRRLAGPPARGRPALPLGRRPGDPDPRGRVTDLVVRGGTVVTATGSRRADVAVRGGVIEAIEADLSGPAAGAAEVVDATGLLVLPGAVDVHTHTRVGTDAHPDRFFQDSVAAAFGGTTTFLAFNNPGTGSSPAAERSLLVGVREWRAATDGDSAVDVRSGPRDQRPCRRPRRPSSRRSSTPGSPPRRRSWSSTSGWTIASCSRRCRSWGATAGCSRSTARTRSCSTRPSPTRWRAATLAPRFHATTRPPYVEAVATARALAFARQADAPVHVVHLSSAAALDEVRRAKAAGVRVTAETCPHYLPLTDERYDDPDPGSCARYVISPPLRSAADRDALWAGLADGSLDLVATDHVPDRLDTEKAEAARGVPFDRISQRRAGDRDAADDRLRRGRRRAAGSPSSGWSTSSRRRRPRRFGLGAQGRDRGRPGRRPRAVRPDRPPDHPRRRPPPHERLHAVRGARGRRAPSGRSSCAAAAVVRDGAFVGQRGFGRFVERGPIA